MSPAARTRAALAETKAGRGAAVIQALAKAANRGDVEAQLYLGKAYLEGAGVPASRATAAIWLEKAAQADRLDAQALLAAVYLSGAGQADEGGVAAGLFSDVEGHEPDYLKALHWGMKAAMAGSGDAQALVGYILSAGPDPMRDQAAADDWFRKSADAGCPQGALGYGLALLRTAAGDGKQAATQIMRAANANLPLGLYLLGVMSDVGTGVERDQVKAVQLYKQAAEKGLRPAQARYGLALLEGRAIGRNAVTGETWLRRAALAGDPEASALLGDLYARGGELPPNFVEAADWYLRSAEGGHAVSARALATLYMTSMGVPRDQEKAAYWLRISGESGDRAARADLGNLILAGGGEPVEDGGKARDWFYDAASGGDLVAAFNYGVCLAEGVGGERDLPEAALWLRRAADGVVNAQYWYGRMLCEGRGVEADLPAGRAWMQRAADSGMIEAQVFLAEMTVHGRGGPRDHAAALALFQAAAAKDHTGAQFAVGALLGGGHDVPMDRVAAQAMFSKAAAKGHLRALLMLGRYLARGLAGEVDPVRAREALTRARAGGVAEAYAELAALPSDVLEDESLDETGPAAPEEPVSLELADLEATSEPEPESVEEALPQPVRIASTPYLSLVPPRD